ncbi:MAG TPA: hypothetical protein P5120_10760, partial [Spirochaetota bacterium]|nr:hypothetical protein [Spirochaetota bacterium]HRX47988.1 hypothetical protein [Spirochaetota bacterium]
SGTLFINRCYVDRVIAVHGNQQCHSSGNFPVCDFRQNITVIIIPVYTGIQKVLPLYRFRYGICFFICIIKTEKD